MAHKQSYIQHSGPIPSPFSPPQDQELGNEGQRLDVDSVQVSR